MTNKELIQAFRECQRHPQCKGCELGDKPCNCCVIESLALYEVINRLEALLAENEHLREATKMVPKWVSVKERLPEEQRRYLCNIKSFAFPGNTYISILRYDKYGFRKGNIYTDDVTHWMPLPSTEGVERCST